MGKMCWCVRARDAFGGPHPHAAAAMCNWYGATFEREGDARAALDDLKDWQRRYQHNNPNDRRHDGLVFRLHSFKAPPMSLPLEWQAWPQNWREALDERVAIKMEGGDIDLVDVEMQATREQQQAYTRARRRWVDKQRGVSA